MSKIKLTAKQEKFVQGLIAGLSQREAYKQAGYSVNRKTENSVDRDASVLFKNPKVFQRYNELMDEHKQKALWTREEAVSALKWLLDKSMKSIEVHDEDYVRQGTANALLGAVQELNKLEATYSEDEARIAKLQAEAKLAEQKASESTATNDFTLEIVDEWSGSDG